MSIADWCVVAAAVVVCILLYLVLRWSLSRLLDDVVALPAATKFFRRTLLLTMLLGALGATVAVSLTFDENSHFMEKVWDVAKSLDSAFWALMVILLVFAVMQTILLAALRRRHEQ